MRRKQDFPARVTELKPAPGDLKIVQAFINTLDLGLGTDVLASSRAFAGWLDRWGLTAADFEPSAAHQKQAITVREALRAYLWSTNGRGKLSAATVEALDTAATQAPIRVRFTEDGGLRLAAMPGELEAALGRIFGIVATAQLDGSWQRLKVCANPACRAAFYDASSNRSGRWCSMRRCGNRIKSKSHQQIQRQWQAEHRAAEPRAAAKRAAAKRSHTARPRLPEGG